MNDQKTGVKITCKRCGGTLIEVVKEGKNTVLQCTDCATKGRKGGIITMSGSTSVKGVFSV